VSVGHVQLQIAIQCSAFRLTMVDLQPLTLIDRLRPENNLEMAASAAPVNFGAALSH
jgi:hypothetical protein